MFFWIQRICEHLKLLAQSSSVFGIRYDPTAAFLLMMRLTYHLIVLCIFYFLVTRSAAASQGVGVLALQQLSERPSGGGQSDTNPQAFCACNCNCNLMRLRLPLRRTARLWRQLWHLLSQAAVLHPMRRKRRRGSRRRSTSHVVHRLLGVGHLAALLAGCQSQ